MFFILSKTLAIFTAPSNLIGFIAALGLILLLLRRKRAGTVALGAAAILLAAIGWLPVGSAALLALENRFPKPDLDRPVAGIVVLGGQIDTEVSNDRGTIALTDAAERLTRAAEFSRHYSNARILLSGGINDLSGRGSKTEAALARDLLVRIGVPAERIELEERSRNTCENAVESKAVAAPRPEEAWLLITSAFHMPRAVACFRAAGFRVLPYPVDYLVRRTNMRTSIAEGLYLADIAAHEWLGLIVYSFAKGTELFPAPRSGPVLVSAEEARRR